MSFEASIAWLIGLSMMVGYLLAYLCMWFHKNYVEPHIPEEDEFEEE